MPSPSTDPAADFGPLPAWDRATVRAWAERLADVPLEGVVPALRAVLQVDEADAGPQRKRLLGRIELLREPLLDLLDRSRTRFLESPLPLGMQAETALRRGQLVHGELRDAYAAVCAGIESQELGELAVIALFRALQHGGWLMLWESQGYRRPPAAYWLSLYRSFALAERLGLLAVPLSGTVAGEPCSTAENQFKRALLFFLANPRRFRQREMAGLFAKLGECAHWARIEADAGSFGQRACFILRLDCDGPPLAGRFHSEDAPGDRRQLLTEEVARGLLEMAAAAPTQPERQDWSPSTLIRAARSLGAAERRRYSRWPETRECRYVVGLRGIILSTPEDARPRPQRAATSPDLELVPLDGFLGGAPRAIGESLPRHELGSLGTTAATGSKPATERARPERVFEPQIWDPAGAGPAEAESFHGRLLNSGPNGYCVFWPQPPLAKIAVSELIGLWGESRPYIAVVRWLENTAEGLCFGVELLAPRWSVVAISNTNAQNLGHGVLLPADPVLRRLPELLALPHLTHEGEILRLRFRRGSADYRVRSVFESTPIFTRLAVVPLANRRSTG